MNPSMRRAPLHDGAAALAEYLARLEAMLADGRPFLLGGVASIADFSAVHSIWFMRRAPPVAAVLGAYPRVVDWFERVTAFGHGESTPLGSDEAIAIAARSEGHAPTSVAAGAGFAADDRVTVAAADYAHDEIAGTIVGLDGEEVVIARDDARAGRVHVHFPRIGFHVKAVKERGMTGLGASRLDAASACRRFPRSLNSRSSRPAPAGRSPRRRRRG